MNEEIGIDALAPPWRVLLCVALPKTKPTADGFCPFRAQVSAKREIENEKMCGFGC